MTIKHTGNRLGMRIMVVLLLLLSLLFVGLFFTMHRWQQDAIDKQAYMQADMVADTMMESLKTLMLSGDAERVHGWLHRMRSHQALQTVKVLRRNGMTAFRDLKTIHQVNAFLGSETFSRDPLPKLINHDIAKKDLARAAQGEDVVLHDDVANTLTILEPIKAEQACLLCHGYDHHSVRGIMLVTTSTAAAKAAMWHTDRRLLLLMLMGLVVVALLIILMHRYMEAIIRTLGGMLFVTDGKGVIRTTNLQACHTLGYSEQPLVGKQMATLLVTHQSDVNFSQVCDGKEAVLQGIDGHHIPVSVFSATMPFGSGMERAYWIHVLRDLSQQKEAEREMRLAATVMDTVPSAIMVADNNIQICLINPAFTNITGYNVEDVLGENPRILQSGRQPQEFYTAMWKQIHQTGRWSGEIWNKRKNGEIYPEWLIINTMHGDDGEVNYYVSTFLDISIQKKMENELRHTATHDVLTGLPNRMMLADRLNHGLSRAHRFDKKIGILFVDIDGFKPINDTYGHDAGDDLLQQISKRLLKCVRASDTVARVGGDEFVLVVESKSSHDMMAVADKVLQTIQQPFDLLSATCQVSASIGISIYPDQGSDPEVLFKQADTAMYVAKNGGKNRAVKFDDSFDEEDD